MKKALKIIIPILMVLVVLGSIVWYLFVYDSAFTQDLLLQQARRCEENGKHSTAVWLYNLAYQHSGADQDVAIELAEQFKSIGNYTKAEYTLSNAIANGGTAELYIALCKTYVEQDKLLDAVNMLDNIADPAIKAELDALRPAAPTASLEPGFYNQYITVDFKADSGTLYVTTNGEFPSIEDDAYEGAIPLSAGETTIYAVTVAENGLVSPVSISGYTVVGVIEPVTFQDAAIEAEVRNMLGLHAETVIYTNDLWNITDFVVPEEAETYQDLAGMTQLKSLVITSAKSDDFSFLTSLQNLESLEISGVLLSSDTLAAIATLVNLQSLSLNNCGISSIAPLANTLQLRTLNLSNNSIRDLEPLVNMLSLESLNLQYNAVNDVSILSSLTNLKTLDLSYNSLSSVSALGSCINLGWLDVSHNKLSSLNGIDNLKALTHLNAAENSLTDLSALATCLELTELDVSNNDLTDISLLSVLVKLMTLDFSYNSVTALPTWPVDCALVWIDGSYNALESIDELADLYNLNRVNMDYNKQINSIDALADCPTLIRVDVYGTLVTDVSALTSHSIIVNFDPTSISATTPEE